MSKSKAVRGAMNSEYADRLVEISVEHIRLANLASKLRIGRGEDAGIDAEVIDARIQQLRNERDAILELFEAEVVEPKAYSPAAIFNEDKRSVKQNEGD